MSKIPHTPPPKPNHGSHEPNKASKALNDLRGRSVKLLGSKNALGIELNMAKSSSHSKKFKASSGFKGSLVESTKYLAKQILSPNATAGKKKWAAKVLSSSPLPSIKVFVSGISKKSSKPIKANRQTTAPLSKKTHSNINHLAQRSIQPHNDHLSG